MNHALSSVGISTLFAVILGGCALDGATTPDPTGENVSQTSQALSQFYAYSWGTTDGLWGNDTNVSMSSWTCLLSGAAGNLSVGGGAYPGVQPRSAVGPFPLDTTWHIFGHGGAYDDGHGNTNWLGKPVDTRSVCVPHDDVAADTWESVVGSVAPPVKIASLGGSTRQCFLTGIMGGLGLWNQSSHRGRVRRITFAGGAYPTTGWYVEGNFATYSASIGNAKVSASCIDFPSGTQFLDSGQVGPETYDVAQPLGASLTGVKACALTVIGGAFTADSYTDGVRIDSPSTQTGSWAFRVKAGKLGNAVCAR